MSIKLKDTIFDYIDKANKDGSGNIISSTYLPKSGGTITGNLIVEGTLNTSSHLQLQKHHLFVRNNEYADWIVTDKDWQHEYSIIHSGNYTDYTYSKSQVDSALGGYLPLSGGTMTGVITLKAEQYIGNYGINAQNSDIINLNAIYTADLANGADEGIQFARTNGNYDSLWAADGVLYFSPNGNNSAHTGWYSVNNTVIHSGNIGSYSFIARGEISNNTDANQLLKNGAYLNATGNGSGNNNFPTTYSMLLNYAQSDRYVGQISIAASTMCVRRKIDTWSEWKEVAFTDSNVASATKLQTARKIWENSFDGTGDVSGFPCFPYEIGINRSPNSGAMLNANYIGLGIQTYGSYIGFKVYGTNGTNLGTPLVIASSGYVGIGTTSPQYKLDVNGTLHASGTVTLGGVQDLNIPQIQFSKGEYFDFRSNLVLHSSSGNWNIFSETASNVLFRVNKNGSVLLGGRTTDDNSSILQINTASTKNAIALYDTARPETSIMYTGNDGYTWIVGKGVGSTGDAFGFYRSGVKLLINSSGNVGIGTINPSYKLDVNGYIHALGLRTKGDYGLWNGLYFSGSLTDDDIALYGNKIILHGGNVGIGTLNPTQKLHVSGGLIGINCNSRYVYLGTQNTSHAHYETDADISHWFNKRVEVNGHVNPYTNNSFSSGTSDKRWNNVYSYSLDLAGVSLSYGSSALAVTTGSGSSYFGMMNSGYCHIYTDGPSFYMNKPLYVDNGNYVIHSGNIGSQSVNYANSAGSCTGNAKGLSSSGYGSTNLTYYQTDGSFFGNSGWSHYIIANHGDGSSYCNFTIGLPFWGVPIYKRLEGGSEDGWHTFITSENISSQSVNYASSAGSSDSVDGHHFSTVTSLPNSPNSNTVYFVTG